MSFFTSALKPTLPPYGLAPHFLATAEHEEPTISRDLSGACSPPPVQGWPQAGDDLVQAMRGGTLDLNFQPIFDLRTLERTRYEASVRWDHHRLGTIPADDIIAIAKQHRLSRKLTEYVLRRACLECASWPSDQGVAVNVAPSDLRSFRLPRMVADALRDASLSPHRLELEICETELLTPDVLTVQTFLALQDLGVRLAMDNFGSGFATANYLARFAFDRVKVHRSLLDLSCVQGRSYGVLNAVGGMLHSLQLPTTISGVETVEQLALVRELDFGEAQGFLLGKPEKGKRTAGGNLDKSPPQRNSFI